MKILKTILVSASALLFLTSCRNEEMLDTFKGVDFSFIGVAEKLGDKPVEWSSSAKVSVLDGVSNVLYQPLSSGEQPKFTSRKGIDDNAMEIYAVWPYSEENELIYGGLKAYLKPHHDASDEVEGLQVAYASDIEQEEMLQFRNVVSYLRVALTKNMGITEVALSGLDNEILAGLAELTLTDGGIPTVTSVTMSSSSVRLVSDRDVLEGEYLIPVFPGTLEKGCVLEFVNEDGMQSKAENTGRLVLERNAVVDFGPVPETLAWQKAPKAQVHGITSNEIVISWSASSWHDVASDFAGKYSLGIYSDSKCTVPVEIAEWDMEENMMPDGLSRLAYVFSGLQPATDYWVKVTDILTNASTAVIAVTTLDAESSSETAEEGEYAIYDSFGYMVYGGDVISGVYGRDDSGICAPDHAPSAEIEGWNFEGNATSHPGYVGLSGAWSLLSGSLSPLKETATVILSFKASGNGQVNAYVVDAANRAAGSVTVAGEGWATYELELLNVSPTSKVLLECNDCVMCLDDLAARVDKYEVVSNAPSVDPGHFFWSDGFITWRSRLGDPDGYNVYVDDVKVNDEIIPNTITQWHLTGLSSGKEHNVVVAAVMGDREDRADPVTVITGAITQITTNLSPRSLSVAIENRAGDIDVLTPALKVELYKENTDNPLFSTIVADGLGYQLGQPFVESKALGGQMCPTNITFGRLEPNTFYRFRVKSELVAEITCKLNGGSKTKKTLNSPNGESEWSEFVTFKTSNVHEPEDGEILFQGFDGCCVNADFINKAVGSVPAWRPNDVTVGDLSYDRLYSWGPDKWSFYPLIMNMNSSQFAQYKWITGVGANQTYPCKTNSSGSTVDSPDFLKGATAYMCTDKASPDLQNWYISNSAWPYQGYIGLGTSYSDSDKETTSKLAFIITEPLETNLDQDNEKPCEITFKGLAMYGKAITIKIAKVSPDGTWTIPIEVKLKNSAGKTDAVQTWPVGDNHKWHQSGPVEIPLKKGDRVGLATNGKGHALIDDIQIKVK